MPSRTKQRPPSDIRLIGRVRASARRTRHTAKGETMLSTGMRLRSWVLALGLCAGVAACGTPAPTSSSGTTKGPLTIGISVSLTGDFSNTGKAAQLGYELWASQVNAKGG